MAHVVKGYVKKKMGPRAMHRSNSTTGQNEVKLWYSPGKEQ